MTRPLVLLHGWGLSARVWAPLRAALGEVHILAPDLPGHGNAPAAGSATVADWTDRQAAALPEGAAICGWSLGALLALDLAARHPAKVSRLVLIGATPRFVAGNGWAHGLAADTVAAFRREFAGAPAAVLRRFLALQALGEARRRELTRVLDEALTNADPDPAQAAALADGLALLADSDLRASVADIRQPTLLIHGGRDALMPVAAARWLAEHLPHAQLEVFADAGHAPFLSRTTECAALLERFLRA